MHPIHPMVVHFPIALLMASVFLDLLTVRWHQIGFRQASLYTLIGGLAGAVVSVITGSLAEELVEKSGVPKAALDLHETLGYATLWLFVGLLAIRLIMSRGWLREIPALSIGVGLVGVVILAATGYYGGSLVYEFGAGVARTLLKIGP
jgi:uncharacterized membrane protein